MPVNALPNPPRYPFNLMFRDTAGPPETADDGAPMEGVEASAVTGEKGWVLYVCCFITGYTSSGYRLSEFTSLVLICSWLARKASHSSTPFVLDTAGHGPRLPQRRRVHLAEKLDLLHAIKISGELFV